MAKIVLFICILALGVSSCRPSYMRCPKNRRCEITPQLKQQQFLTANSEITYGKITSHSF